MGVYSDLLEGALTLDRSGEAVGIQRSLYQKIEGLRDYQGDLDYPSGYEAVDEVQEIAVHTDTVASGTFTLTFNLSDGTSFTTDAIEFDATVAGEDGIQELIDEAADGEVAGYEAGDIVASGGPLTTDPVVLTFSGDSVSGARHGLTVITNVDMVDGGASPVAPGEVTVDTSGQQPRTAWAILKATGAIDGTIPLQGEVPTQVTYVGVRSNPYLPDQATLRFLATEAGVQDGNAEVTTTLLGLFGLA